MNIDRNYSEQQAGPKTDFVKILTVLVAYLVKNKDNNHSMNFSNCHFLNLLFEIS